MKRLLAIGVCLLLALPALAQNPAAVAPSSWLPAPQAHPAVARVVAPGNGSIAYGSGTLVYASEQYGVVITNWHVVNEATGPISVHFPDGFYSLGSVQRVDRDWDLAAIVIRKPNAQPVHLANAAPRPGETLTIAGYGKGTYRAASGPCTQYVAPGTTFPYEMVEVAVSARQGDSGGPIFNSQGELAGVLWGEGQGRTSGSYCGRVRWFLSNLVPGMSNSGTLIAGAPLKPVPPRPPTAEVRADAPSIPLPPTPFIQASRASGIAAPSANGSRIGVVASTRSPPLGVRSTHYVGWEDVAGHSIGEQLKTLLAVIGAMPIIIHTLRWFGRARTARQSKS